MLKEKFYNLAQKYCADIKQIDKEWQNIKKVYSNKDRHYHNLLHIEHIFKELKDTTLEPYIEFAIFYHDIIYNPLQNNNEENSAIYAQKALERLNVDTQTVAKCKNAILASKKHKTSNTKLLEFLDADLAILAQDWQVYKSYTKQIRAEYAHFSNKAYKIGRQKVIESFLNRDTIYKSNKFYAKYEQKARENLQKELLELK